jgi:hypothetical protein
MGTQITITTDDAALAADLISLINGSGVQAEVAAPAPAAKAPAKKAAAAPAKKAAAPAPEPEPEAVEDEVEEDEDLVGGEAYTMKDAVARATALVSAGHTPRVKEALAGQGVKRVSELKGDDAIAAFMESLSDLD